MYNVSLREQSLPPCYYKCILYIDIFLVVLLSFYFIDIFLIVLFSFGHKQFEFSTKILICKTYFAILLKFQYDAKILISISNENISVLDADEEPKCL